MKEILQENSDGVRQAGEALVEIGTELAAGRIENALGRLEAAQQQYRAWAELDQAIIDIQEAVHDRKNGSRPAALGPDPDVRRRSRGPSVCSIRTPTRKTRRRCRIF